MSIQNIIKLILSILFLLCLLKMPYGFYVIVRFVALVGFAVLAFSAHDQKKEIEMVIYIALAILFQPFVKISLGRDLWNIIDVIVAAVLLFSLYEPKSKSGE